MSVDAHPPTETFTRKDLARAWDEGWKASVRSPHTAPYSDDNPYRAAVDLPAERPLTQQEQDGLDYP